MLSTKTMTAVRGMVSKPQPETKILPLTAAGFPDTSVSIFERFQKPCSEVSTSRVSGTLWLRLPLVPWTVSAELPIDALPGTTNDTWAEELAFTLKPHDGEQVMPEGNPVMLTPTVPEKPFKELTETVNGELVVPILVLIEEDETEMEKSGAGGDAVTVKVKGCEWFKLPLVP